MVLDEKYCVVDILYSLCVCARAEAAVQLGLMTPLGFKLSNMLSLIRMCGGVDVGV